ncbi:hypothetical protein GW813_04225 [bacterium]|nr:hypothetical protein [bacterium]PJA74757.1 MAG: hypothetical protein CO151_08485 [bacterium CG_4_9_14_3_um_filter_65_15]
MTASGALFADLRLGPGERTHLRLQYRHQLVREQAAPFPTVLETWTNEFAVLMGMRLTHPCPASTTTTPTSRQVRWW